MDNYETLLIIIQRDATTSLQPLPTGNILTLTELGGLPGPPAEGSQDFDPGDLRVYFENGLI